MIPENVYKQASDKWGEKAQIIVAIEEMAELTQALTKYLRTDQLCDNIAEELADVEIMTEQLRLIFDKLKYDIDRHKEAKIFRLQKKLESA